MSVSWPVWAKGLKGLTPSQSLVLFELARLADARGVVICAVDHLARSTGGTRRSVFRALAGLEERGVLSREMRYMRGKQASSRFQLYWSVSESKTVPSATSDVLAATTLRVVSDASEVVVPLRMSDNDGLRLTLVQAAAEGWRGVASRRLVVTLKEVGARQFSTAISRGVQFSRLSRSEAEADTFGIAWEVARTCTQDLIEAARPWALWTTIVTSRCLARDAEADMERLVEPSMMPERGVLPGGGEQSETWVSVDDFEGPLARMVEALILAGMDETLAWAGTLRVAELAVGDSTRRHRAASVDPRLSDLGVTPEAGRAWMTMLVGSRRGVKAGILDQDDESLLLAAREVVEAINMAA